MLHPVIVIHLMWKDFWNKNSILLYPSPWLNLAMCLDWKESRQINGIPYTNIVCRVLEQKCLPLNDQGLPSIFINFTCMPSFVVKTLATKKDEKGNLNLLRLCLSEWKTNSLDYMEKNIFAIKLLQDSIHGRNPSVKLTVLLFACL